MYKNISLSELKQLVASEQRLIIMDCHALWCGPCKRIAPEIEGLEREYNGEVVVVKVDIDECDDIADEFGISSLPTILFFKHKQMLDTVVGADMNSVRGKIAMYKN